MFNHQNVVVYHKNCADGFGAAFAAWVSFRDDAEYVPFQYGTDPAEFVSQLDARHNVFILDFSFVRPVMDLIRSKCKRLVWLDHHDTAFDHWGAPVGHWHEVEEHALWITLDKSKSGAMLAWEFFYGPNAIPMFVHHIDDYDRWQFKLEKTKSFNKALWSLQPWSFEQWYSLFEWSIRTGKNSAKMDQMYLEGDAMLRAHNQNVASVVAAAQRNCVIVCTGAEGLQDGDTVMPLDREYVGLAAACPSHLTSDVGNDLARLSGSYGLCWTVTRKGKVVCGLRSFGDYDVSKIAQKFGGGGHKNAAGFEIPILTLLGWIGMVDA